MGCPGAVSRLLANEAQRMAAPQATRCTFLRGSAANSGASRVVSRILLTRRMAAHLCHLRRVVLSWMALPLRHGVWWCLLCHRASRRALLDGIFAETRRKAALGWHYRSVTSLFWVALPQRLGKRRRRLCHSASRRALVDGPAREIRQNGGALCVIGCRSAEVEQCSGTRRIAAPFVSIGVASCSR